MICQLYQSIKIDNIQHWKFRERPLSKFFFFFLQLPIIEIEVLNQPKYFIALEGFKVKYFPLHTP